MNIMNELTAKLENISDAYVSFVHAVQVYAKKKPERLKRVLEYIDNNQNALSSDILEFVFKQPDFKEDVEPTVKEKVSLL